MADKSAASALHNLLSGRFVRDIAGHAIKSGASYSQLMVLFESNQLAMLELLNLHYQLAPATAVDLLEVSMHAAIVRFADNRKASHG
ncbi:MULTISPECIES: hypothetical protein [unclassified Mesorhizobium]|uniref:hypothetical protein n=1 Tax=unclassified Mesorhizobium TaxID=325217 RepID=UPI001127269F|nr:MULTISPECIES: hypothetical protein [unclassified Mesorhizobium]MCA0025511.1 hypothetical protein [Mesorhizobium sp. B263B1A]TPJ97107.1 hypothetical protein FJ489_11735 [Mesorhizobium sp. B2-5-12]TPK27227.1 hypothetical protein FJ562_08290 [Mesorhizobium sp. B2-5-6]